MTTPTDIIWRAIGDVFSTQIFRGKGRRVIDGLWQGLSDMAADSLDYVEWIRRAQSPITADAYAPWGIFPVEPLLDEESGADGRLLGYQTGSFYRWSMWSADNAPRPSGSLILPNGVIDYSSLSSRPLASGGAIYRLSGAPQDESQVIAQGISDTDRLSYDFGVDDSSRFVVTGQGAGPLQRSENGWQIISPPGTSLHLVADQVEASLDWQMTWVFDNKAWPAGGLGIQRQIRIESFSDAGDFALVLQDINGVLVTSPPLPGNHIDAYAALNAGAQIEMSMEYDSSTQLLRASIYVGTIFLGETSVSIPPAPRKFTIVGYNQIGTCDVDLVAIVSRFGEPRFSSADTSVSTSLTGGALYRVDPDIIDCTSISSEPWPIQPNLENVSFDTQTISGRVPEDWLGWSPEYGRIDVGDGWYSLKKSSSDDDGNVVYDIVARHGAPGNPGATVVLSPWFTDQVSFESRGLMAAPFDTPPKVWLSNTRGIELDMHGRWGEKLGFSQRDDSPEYLDAIQGTWMGKARRPTRSNLEDAVGVFLGVPFSVRGGTITQINDFGDTVELIIANVPHVVDARWKNLGLSKVGDFIEPYGLLADTVTIDDYKTNPSQIISTFGVWAQWRAFLVRVPANIGASPDFAAALLRMIETNKKKTHEFRILFEATEQPQALEQVDELALGITIASNRVDTVFDDGYAVTLAPGDPDTPGVDVARVGLEPIPFAVPEAGRGLEGRRVKADWSRRQLTPGGWAHNDRGRDLARPLEAVESSLDFGRNALRFSNLGVEPHRPSSLCAVKEVSTGALARNVVLVVTQGNAGGDIRPALDTFADSTTDRVGVLLMSTTDCATTTTGITVGANSAAALKATWAGLTNTSAVVNTGEALLEAYGLLTPGGDPDEYRRQKVVILITDQDSTCPTDAVAAANGLRAAGVDIYVMALGASATTEMSNIGTATPVGASGATLASEMDSALASERSQLAAAKRVTFEAGTLPVVSTFAGAWVDSAKEAQICGGTNDFYRTTDYGENWTLDAPGATAGLNATSRNWVVGGASEAFEYVGASWIARGIVSSGGPFVFSGVDTKLDGAVVVYGNNGADGALFFSTDRSLPFTQYDVSGLNVQGARWFGDLIAFTTSDGQLRLLAPGAATDRPIGIGDFVAVSQSGIIVTLTTTGRANTYDGPNVTESVTGIAFESIHWIRGSEYMAIVGSNQIYQSLDHGQTWVSLGTFGTNIEVIAGSPKRRIIAVGDEVFTWK